MTVVSIKQGIEDLKAGKVIAYPTEAVYGLGCDPNNKEAIKQVIALKKRTLDKGLIIVGGKFSHLSPYIALKEDELPNDIQASWPGPNNWLLPANINAQPLLRGQYETQAVRISQHPVIQALCALYQQGIVSTSANKSNQQPCNTIEELHNIFGKELSVVEGELGKAKQTCSIRHYASKQKIR